ncbi:MAG: Rieske (2Fe-2S) protein [Actinomycetota bacterium]|nr:Rieske (2Fe-2S) protein [Actinomycetota bacterium]
MPDTSSLPESALTPGAVRSLGRWAVGNRDGELFAVSRRCRHQLGDLADGWLDRDGCLVCPWHQSRYDVRTGRMVAGPRGFLAYQGSTPGYSELVLAYGRVLRLRLGRLVRRAGRVQVR